MKSIPAGYDYDPELSDSHTAGYSNIDGEQWYCRVGEARHEFPAGGFGLPYARAGVDNVGPFARCPVCGLKCRADSFRNEDEATKGPALSYAGHFEMANMAESATS